MLSYNNFSVKMSSLNTAIFEWFFQWKDEKESIGIIGSLDTLWVEGILEWLFDEKLEEKAWYILKKMWWKLDLNTIDCTDISYEIESTSNRVIDILGENFQWINDKITSLKYRMYLFWVKKVLSRCWFDSDSGMQDIPDLVADKIYRTVQDRPLTSFLLFIKSFWAVDITDNLINKIDQEKELKVLEVDKDDLSAKLEAMWAEKWFEGMVIDDYYDTPDLQLDNPDLHTWRAGLKNKRSFRIRKRVRIDEKWEISKNSKEDFFYTLKQKLSKATSESIFRDCLEDEFGIKKEFFPMYRKAVEAFGFKNSRSKEQYRKSYQIIRQHPTSWDDVHIKFDISKYDWMPTFLEIECDSEEVAIDAIAELWLSDNKQLKTWSRWLFKHYGKYHLYNNKCRKENGWVIWDDGTKVPLPEKINKPKKSKKK